MTQTAEKIRYEDVFVDAGTVIALEPGGFAVRRGNLRVVARRAVSCLVEPEVGDRVLLASPDDACFILAVLEREAGKAARVVLDGDLEVRLPKGRFAVSSQEGIDLATAKEAALVAGRLAVNAVKADVVVEAMSFLGSRVHAEIERVKLVAEHFDSVLDRLHQRIKRSYRFVEETDQVRADHLDYIAKKQVRVHGHDAILTADQLVKMDGEQVHIG
jgi:hypothetical protein